MQDSKLISLLKTFTKDELRSFDDFVSSPYFNKNSNALKLLRHVSKYSDDYNNEKLSKPNAYKALFPGKNYNIKIMKNLMTELLRLAERFLVQLKCDKNELEKYNYLLEELLNRMQYSMIPMKIKSAEQLSAMLKKDENYFYNNLNLYSLKHTYSLRTTSGPEKINLMEKSVGYLFGFFLIWYFKFNYNLLIRKYGYNFDVDLNFAEKIVEYMNESDIENKNIMLIYYYMFIMNLKYTDEKYFYEFKQLVENYSEELTKGEQHNLYTAIQGYCQSKVMGGHYEFGAILFEACKDMISKEAYSGEYDNVMHPLTYKNIAKAGSNENQFEWTLNFINSYREKLPPEFRDNVYYFCLSYCHFRMKDYEKSLHYLSPVKYENVYDKAEVNRLMMQLYYEMELTEEFLSLADTYKHFLHNDKLIAESQKPLILNFVKVLLNLYKIKTIKHSTDYDIVQIKNELTGTKIYEKKWLMEKLQELSE